MNNTYKKRFFCKTNDSLLVIGNTKYIADNSNEEVISIYLSEKDVVTSIFLSIKDAEFLMDAIHKTIIKAEGGE